MRTTAKIRKRKIRGDSSYSLSIIHNFRNPMSGSPTNITVAYLGTVRESEISHVAESWWKATDAKLEELQKQNKIWVNDAASIKRKFEAIIPKPATKVPKVTPATSVDEIRVALAKRGISL